MYENWELDLIRLEKLEKSKGIDYVELYNNYYIIDNKNMKKILIK
jgi:hypothetical protein